MKPIARIEGLRIEATEAGLQVHDEASERTWALPTETANIWRAADGTQAPAELAERLELPQATVWAALDDLADADLLVARVSPPGGDLSRRAMLQLVVGGTAALALPWRAQAQADAKKAAEPAPAEEEKEEQPPKGLPPEKRRQWERKRKAERRKKAVRRAPAGGGAPAEDTPEARKRREQAAKAKLRKKVSPKMRKREERAKMQSESAQKKKE